MLQNVAEIFRPIQPIFPIPATIRRPRQASRVSTARNAGSPTPSCRRCNPSRSATIAERIACRVDSRSVAAGMSVSVATRRSGRPVRSDRFLDPGSKDSEIADMRLFSRPQGASPEYRALPLSAIPNAAGAVAPSVQSTSTEIPRGADSRQAESPGDGAVGVSPKTPTFREPNA